jgi:hypothetical protein
MSAIGTANPFASGISSLFSANSSDPSRGAAPGTPDIGSGNGQSPATHIDLSDKVKQILARASSDQDVADRLRAFVNSHFNDGLSSTHGADDDGNNVSKGFAQLSGASWGDDGSGDDAPVEVGNNFATGLKADGYTISAIGRARDGSFQIQIVGPDGNSFLDRRFGTSGEFSTFSGIGPGEAAQSYQRDNKEYITFSDSEAAAASVTASSDAGFVSATSAATHTASVTFVVDFSTGAISLAKSESTSVSTTVQIGTPGSTVSALA